MSTHLWQNTVHLTWRSTQIQLVLRLPGFGLGLEKDHWPILIQLNLLTSSSSSRMHVMNHNWSATKQHLHPQSVAELSRHSVLSGDRI